MKEILLKWLAEPQQIIKYPANILRQKTLPVEESDELYKVCQIALEIMYKNGGAGLAANQVNLPYSFFVMNASGDPVQKPKEHIVINPVILKVSKRTTIMEEGCLSIPGIKANVERPKTILLEAIIDGKKQKVQYDGLTGRVVQHETDHLCGVLFIDRI